MSAASAFASRTKTSKTSRRCETPSTTCSPSSVDQLHEIPDLTIRLGHVFRDPQLLTLALTHRSWCAENAGSDSNERLELLGDAVLGLVVAEYAYLAFRDLSEGHLAKVRAAVVSSQALADVARQVGLGPSLRLGKGEEASGGRSKTSILADAMEAVIGAVMLDAGYPGARALVVQHFAERVDASVAEGPGEQDYKTRLQELTARTVERLPVYELRAEGPDHDRRFSARVSVGGTTVGEGEGRSKKSAEQAAAAAGLLALMNVHEGTEDA